MKKILCTALALLLTAGFFSSAKADDAIKGGKWSVTAVITTTGLPAQAAAAAAPQTHTSESCLTNQNLVPDMKMPAGCATPQIDKKDGTVTFSISCDTNGMKMTSTGHVTYSGDTMEGTSTSQMSVGGMDVNSTAQLSGKYLGPCDK